MGLNSDFINNLVDELLEDIQEENKGVQENHELLMGRAVTEQEFEEFMAQHDWVADDYLGVIEDEDMYNQTKQDGTWVPDYTLNDGDYMSNTPNVRKFIADGVLDLNV